MTFSPIAIVGRACLLPGALSPEALWSLVLEGRDQIEAVPAGRWRLEHGDVRTTPDGDPSNRTWSDRGGYVSGFETVWDPSGFAVDAATLDRLDPLFQWTLFCAREALADAGDHRRGTVDRPRVGAVFGNLGFPSGGLTEFAESVWHGEPQGPHPLNRFFASGAATIVQQALGLAPGVTCLDTACASSLYAIKLACDQLHDGQVDLVLAGAVNRADDLFIHVGFTALNAMSHSGQSRPFNADADGLVPAEGAGFVALKRLADARRDGDHIYGILRGIGLSNDGRSGGFLAPSEAGQRRALEQAYEQAGLSPADISLLECHATGTSVGDAAEIRSTGALFEGLQGVPVGSLKSNMGHLITAAGVAGLIKVLEAIRHRQRPPSLHADPPNPALADSPFRVLAAAEPWDCPGPRIAGVSAFGFGGNNAHLLVSEDDDGVQTPGLAPVERTTLAIVGVGTVVGTATDRPAFVRALLDGASLVGANGAMTGDFEMALAGLRFPPRDLAAALPQQLLLLKAAREAMAAHPDLAGERTGVFVAMEPEVEVCRFGLRWRMPQRLRDQGLEPDDQRDWLDPVLEAVVATLTSAGVVGNMPNIPANRLNGQFDLGGGSWSISAGETGGLRTLALAHRALSAGELDAAVVGAVDLSCQSVHTEALRRLEGKQTVPGDAAVVLLLKRLADAERDGDAIVAVLDDGAGAAAPVAESLDDRFGRSWAAGGLRDLVATALGLSHRAHTDGRPWLATAAQGPSATVGQADRFTLQPHGRPAPALAVPGLQRFAAADTVALLAALDTGREGGTGPCKLVLLAATADQFAERATAARRHIREGTPTGPGVYFRAAAIDGELAFVFAGAGSGYAGMGHALLKALPELGEGLAARHPVAAAALDMPWSATEQVPPGQRLWGASALCQLHAALSQELLGLQPDAVIGYSSGESNSLFASGTWTDLDAMIQDASAGQLFSDEIGGQMNAVQRAWGRDVQWETWTVLASVDEVRALVANEEHVHLSVIHSDTDCIVAGDASGCARVCDAIGRQRCLRLHYDLAVHVPELDQVRQPWLALHRRPVTPQDGIRIYSAGHGGAYVPTETACAEAILAQANRPLDFRRVIEAAWADGVRVFVEHGPQGSCSRWIRDILGDRDAVVVHLDRRGAGLQPLLEAVAALWVAGVEVEVTPLLERIALEPAETGPSVRFAAHPPAVEIPPMPLAAEPAVPAVEQPTTEQPAARQPAMQRMDPAPSLPSVMERVQYTAAVLPPPQSGPSPGPLALESMAEQPFLAAMHQHTEALSTSNLQHIATQTAVNQRFVALQSQAMALLVQGLGQSPVQASLHGPAAGQRLTPFSAPLPSALELRQAPPRPQKAPPRAGEAPARPPEATPRPLASPTERKPLSSPLAPSPPPTGPTFDRSQLEIHASGQISAIFGQRFAVQDGFHRQVRMPEPPLLLADRVTGLDAEVGSMGLGTIWSETDISAGAWYLHQGHMPAGIMIEAGQADLMLISYLGVDFSNRNDRVYRLLGCELTYHGGLPEVGDTLAYDIHMDGHAIQGDVRLMFFHYDCRVDGEVRLAVRKGQAGFFTDAELADSDGCLWSAEEVTPPADARLDPPAVACTKRDFTEADIVAFAAGRPWDCFGPGFDRSRPHTRTPRIQDGPMLLLGPITDFDPGGGPWQRGYIKSTVQVQPETWFFDGHFKNDPCMPGTLMLEGCLQLMAFYLSAMGYTLNRDGWRFEPLNDVPFPLSCRGQVTPRCRQLTYELFVQELHDGPIPTLFADLLCTVDGLKAFHAGRLALQLRPAWPLDEGSAVLANHSEDKPVAKAGDFPFDFRSLVACANGRPSEAFGPIYGRFDGPGRVARLPNPPYHFLSRVTSTSAEIGAMAEGTEVVVEYDIPADAWYFDENGCRTIPFAVLLEAALQPCGWLASFLGCALTTDTELCFRNLDGTGTIHVDLLPDAGTLVTRVKNTGISSVASMIVVSFEVKCSVGEVGVYDLVTVFGFFPQSALENQVGLPTTDEQRALLEAAAENVVDLTKPSPPRWNRQRPSLAEPMLLMLDRIERFDPEGGPAGLGSARAVKDVDPGEWFFKAHFFQDPVQPGSLGIEAMIQLLQWLMLEKGLDEGIDKPRFEAIALGQEMSWKYRGQVIPENERISTTLELTEIRREAGGVLALADASLWVDGKRIYEASGLGMRIVSGDPPQAPARNLDPARDTWLGDHRPTWTLPALPMMSMVDLLAQGASASDPVTALYDVRIKGWLTFDGPRTLRTDRQGEHMRLVAVDTDGNETTVATARVCTGTYGRPPAPLPALSGEAMTLPYETGELFHGPAFQVLQSLVRTSAGASSVLEASTEVPIGRLNPALLDGATHGIPHDRLHIWDETLSTDKVAYPALIPQMQFFGPTPTIGTLRCEVRPDGNLGSEDFPAFQVQLIGDCGVWCSFRLVEACFDKGAIGHAPAPDRRAFLRDRIAIPGVRTSTLTDGVTRLNEADVAAIDWLPGTVHGIYGSRDPSEIAVREHIAAANGVHPGIVPAGLPLQRFDLHTERDGDEVVVTGDGRGVQCLDPVVDFWTRWFDRDPWLVEDLYFGLIERFLGRVVLTDPDAFDAVHGRSLLYVANHQVGVESLLFSIIASGLTGVPTVTLAKAEHRHTWLGMLIAHCFAYPGVADPRVITFFDRQDKASLPAILGELAEDMTGSARSVMVHVEGTRSLDCTVPVQKMSGAFLDMAIAVNAPVVPVRFVGGLPRQTLGQRLEFPLGMGRQDIYFGRPMLPENLARMPYGERRQRVLAAINALGPGHAIEEPFAGDVDFANGVAKWQAEHGVSEEHAVLGCILTERQEPTAETRLLLAAKTSAALGDEAVGRWLTELARRVLGRE